MQGEKELFYQSFYCSLPAIPSMRPCNGFLSGKLGQQQYCPRGKTEGLAINDVITVGLKKQPYRTTLPIERTEINVFQCLAIALQLGIIELLYWCCYFVAQVKMARKIFRHRTEDGETVV